jgi:hypothetical protein
MKLLIVYRCQSGVTMIVSDLLKDFEWYRDRKGYCLSYDPHLIALHDLQQLSYPGAGTGEVPRQKIVRAPEVEDQSRVAGTSDPLRNSLIGLIIVPRGHADSTKYRPFARGVDHWKAFASVKSPQELLRFVNDHGLLRTGPPLSPRNPHMFVFPAESVLSILHSAKMFRELERLKAQGNPRKLASYFESNRPIGLEMGSVELVGDPSAGLRLNMRPPHLLGALWYQFGSELSQRTLRTCPVCDRVFKVGVGTGLRADAMFCCHDHKVKFFNSKRPRATQKSKRNKR